MQVSETGRAPGEDGETSVLGRRKGREQVLACCIDVHSADHTFLTPGGGTVDPVA